jgi:N6-adenosine-specific RNA methylase IME4
VAGRYRTIVADPPWKYASAATKADASRHYETQTLGWILSLGDETRALAEDDAHLWLWTTNALMEEGYDVVRAWGFRPLTLLTWCKPQPGVGYYLRNNTEHCIFATKGRPMVPDDKPTASWFVWPRAEHSKKPDAFYDLVEQVSPPDYLELFARRARFGWSYWGDQSLGTAEVAA